MKKIHFRSLAIFIVFGLFFVFSPSAFAGTLTNVSVSAVDPSPSATTTYTFSFTTETSVPATPNMILQLGLPTGFNLSNVDPSAVSATVNGVAANVDITPGYVGTYLIAPSTIGVRLNQSVPAGAQVSISVEGIVNNASLGTYSFSLFRSATGGGSEIDASTSLPTITVANVYTFAGGDGTSGNPYQIETCEQLQQIGADTTLLSLHYVLKNDINCGPGGPIGNNTHIWNPNVDEWQGGVVGGTLIPDEYNTNYPNRVSDVVNNGYRGFLPIGSSTAPFTGTFNGQGHSIDNLWIFRKGEPLTGIFGLADGATFSNVVISNTNVVGNSYTGGLVGIGQASTTISNVRVVDSMTRAYLSENGGGIVGSLSDGTITNSEVQGGSVHGSGNIIGGLVGVLNSASIQDATSTAAIDGGNNIGGAVGNMTESQLLNVHATGRVIGTLAEPIKSGTYIGGLVGRATYNSSISNSSAGGYVTGEGDYVGGLVGYAEETSINNSYATGNVSAESRYYVGGLVGATTDSSSINTSYAKGNVSGGTLVGGLVGFVLSTSIDSSYSTGNVTGSQEYTGSFAGVLVGSSNVNRSFTTGNVSGVNFVGGFVGYVDSEISNSYARGNVTGSQNYIGGFAGSNEGSIMKSYATGNVEGTGSGQEWTNVGGFVGDNVLGNGSITDSFSVGTVSATPSYVQVGSFAGFNGNTISNSVFKSSVESGIGGGTDAGATSVSGVSVLQSNNTNPVFSSWNFDTAWSSFCNQYPNLTWYGGVSVQCQTPVVPVQNNSESVRSSGSSGGRLRVPVTTTTIINTSLKDNGATTTVCSAQIYPTQPIRLGAQNDPTQVTLLQRYLNTFEKSNLPVTGIYSEKDKQAVIAWQQKYASDILTPWGITNATGYVHTTSLQKFKSLFLAQCKVDTTNRDLQLGMSGNNVTSLQTLLIDQGYSIPAGATGYFGSQTKTALAAYQAKNAIIPAQGYFGIKTRTQMKLVGLKGLWW
jgi:peptidoglycan hydrolase-like protein with peptidoglycan-binding domain